MESRKMVLRNLFTGQQWRNRHREYTYGHGERGGEGEMYGKSNMETYIQIRSDQISRSVMSDSLRPHELQPGLPVHHQLPEFTQTHVHQVSDAIQPSHPLSSPSPPAPNSSQHQSLFQGVNSSHEVAKVLEFQF